MIHHSSYSPISNPIQSNLTYPNLVYLSLHLQYLPIHPSIHLPQSPTLPPWPWWFCSWALPWAPWVAARPWPPALPWHPGAAPRSSGSWPRSALVTLWRPWVGKAVFFRWKRSGKSGKKSWEPGKIWETCGAWNHGKTVGKWWFNGILWELPQVI